MSPRRDYQNDVRIPLTATNIVEVRTAWRGFTSGYGKVCLLPELLTGKVYDDCTTNALYVQLERTSTNVTFTAYRHFRPGQYGRTNVAPTATRAYSDGRTVTLQISTNWLQVYYGTSSVISVAHGLTNAASLFSAGAFPHLEIQNSSSPTINSIIVDNIGCRSLPTFGGALP